MKQKLWTRNYTTLTLATILGAAGGITGNFALSLLVYDETGSTLASAILIAMQIFPNFLIPLIASPIMDRIRRKPVLVAGDAINGLLYALAGVYLLRHDFSYIGYLLFSLLISSLGSFDQLAYQSIFPSLIPEGMEQKGYTVSGMIYPVMQVIMMPVAAWLVDFIGVGQILILQGILSMLAAALESSIRVQEIRKTSKESFSVRLWFRDLKAGWCYLKKEKGLLSVFSYMAVTNGVATGYSPILTAFFRSTPGFTIAMYGLFSGAEFIGRTIGGILHYNVRIPPKRRYAFAFFVYQIYEFMDMILLWLPYPFMLLNRGLCGFFGIQSASMRGAAVQSYLKEEFRARVNAFQTVMASAAAALLSVFIGILGEFMDLRLCITICGALTMTVCWLTVFRNRTHVRTMYEYDADN